MSMMLFQSPCLKSLKTGLNPIVHRLTIGTIINKHLPKLNQVQHQLKSFVTTGGSNGTSSSSTLDNKHIVYSRHADCHLHNQTAVQRFFERASLWPNLTALVRPIVRSQLCWVFKKILIDNWLVMLFTFWLNR